MAFRCVDVIAPSKVARRAGDRIKTDRRDALHVAEQFLGSTDLLGAGGRGCADVCGGHDLHAGAGQRPAIPASGPGMVHKNRITSPLPSLSVPIEQ